MDEKLVLIKGEEGSQEKRGSSKVGMNVASVDEDSQQQVNKNDKGGKRWHYNAACDSLCLFTLLWYEKRKSNKRVYETLDQLLNNKRGIGTMIKNETY